MIILATLVPWYQALKKIWIATQAKAQALEIGHTALQYVRKDLKAAGYLGCRSFDNNFPIRKNFIYFGNQHPYFRTDRVIFGLQAEGHCQAKLPATICQRLKKGSDLFILYNVAERFFDLQEDMKSAREPLYVDQEKPLPQGSLVLISDCQQGDLFVVNTVAKNRIFHEKGPTTNFTANLSKRYKKNTEVVELQTIAYYLGIPKRHTQHPQTYSLFRDNLSFNAEEVIEGITDLQIEYGIWDAVLGMVYKPAANIQDTQWKKVTHICLKITTKTNHIWEYRLAIRNWQHTYSSVHNANGIINFVTAPYEARHVD